MTINARIKTIREALGFSQTAFASRLVVSPSAVAKLESGVNNPSEQTIKLICSEFGVSYNWLKNGVEPMMVPREYLDRGKVDDILDGDNEFVKQIFVKLAGMPEEWWAMAEKALREALGMEKDR